MVSAICLRRREIKRRSGRLLRRRRPVPVPQARLIIVLVSLGRTRVFGAGVSSGISNEYSGGALSSGGALIGCWFTEAGAAGAVVPPGRPQA
ncbi:Uncharacterised protein [Serratia rubidaea]|uniref:Uncharacterized protein n=1 Tax=Serratia rubidaea TaxID=61652 RepID=A0A3S4JXQ4_SERRU|nr:Uncharacterised protein [Serratia rubidaea]